MKSFRMKSLSLAVLALTGLGMAQSAAAVCNNATPFVAWSSWNPNNSTNVGAAFGGSTVAADGLNGTSCSMASKFTQANVSLGESANVYDQSPAKEQTYRFRFYIDPTNLQTASLTSSTQVAIFGAQSAANHGTVKPNNNLVRMYILGNGTGTALLRTFAACNTGDNFQASRCRSLTGDVTLAAGPQRIEGQLIIGGAGTGKVNIWIGSNVGTPDAVINVDNSAWGGVGVEGVKQANLGLFQATGGVSGYQGVFLNTVVRFDEFDSRRQTAIGP